MSVVLVLNADYQPLNVTTERRGFVLVEKGKAEIIKSGDKNIITTVGEFVRPLIIRLLRYIKFRPPTLRVNRRRIFKRDDFTCQYCESKRHLTIDHVVPKSRGGKNTWDNLVTCCSRCNTKKGNRTPAEAGMKLINQPYTPTIVSAGLYDEVGRIWSEFQESFSFS